MLASKMNEYASYYQKNAMNQSQIYQEFVNYTILKSFQPAAFSAANSLCDLSNVDGCDDMGIDAISICVNNILISSKEDVEEMIKSGDKISVTFILIQSKYREKIESGEYGKFADGIEDFLGDKHIEPHNESVENWLKIKDYIFSNNIGSLKENPNVKLYYACPADCKNDKHIVSKQNVVIDHIEKMNMYGQVTSIFLDNKSLLALCDENENKFSATIDVVDSFQLNQVEGISSSEVVLCNADGIVSLMKSKDGRMRKTLFDDNVRDYQGETSINNEIMETLKDDPSHFALMNNGITITCADILSLNRKLSIKNPHIVNGCQTCSTLFLAAQKGIDISEVKLIVKIVAVADDDITNKIVRSNNRQNIVYDESFETTREFHKDLEQYFDSMPMNSCKHMRFYYERRSKQYSSNNIINITNKVNFRFLIQSVISMFLHRPNEGSLHQSVLLEKYKNKLFITNQSFYPYYIAPCLELSLENNYRYRENKKYCMTYKNQLLFIFACISVGFPPDINDSNIDKYCSEVEKFLTSDMHEKFVKNIDKSILLFGNVSQEWIATKNNNDYKYGLKDNADFNKFLIEKIKQNEVNGLHLDKSELNIPNIVEENQNVYRGTVRSVRKDKYNHYYGFIYTREKSVFVHSKSNVKFDFSHIDGMDVLYRIVPNGNNSMAIIQSIVEK